MTVVHPSELFLEFWREKTLMVTSSKQDVALSDIARVWSEVFQACEDLLKAVQDQTINLVDVDRLFSQYDKKNLDIQLVNLLHGVCMCTGKHVSGKSKEEIHTAVVRMCSYWDLCKYRDTANVFLKIRDALKLTKGNFRDVEKLSQEVNAFTNGF